MTPRALCLTLSFLLAASASSVAAAQMASLPGTGKLAPAKSDTFTFIVAGDNRPKDASLPQPDTPKQIFAAAKSAGANFYVWTGDMIVGLDAVDTAIIRKQYTEYFTIARTAGVPVFAAPGNHEMDVKVQGDSTRKEIGSALMQALYRTNLGLPNGTPIWGSFKYANSMFILLNTEEIPPPNEVRSPPAKTDAKVNLDPGYVSKAQLDWLKGQLDSNTATHTFIFMHHPIKAKKSDMALDSKSAKALEKLFAKHQNISYVLQSHEHLYYNVQTKDTTSPPSRKDPTSKAPYYLISGGAGAPLTGTPEKGGFHHYLVFRVAGKNITATRVNLP